MEQENGLIYFIFIFTVCISTDIGGYLFGRLIGGIKITTISPKKTYAGSLGGILLSITIVYILLNYLIFFHKIVFNFSFSLIGLIVLISIISQIGDLIISYFKRLSKIKDTGKLIPGHGGLLDRIDGMLFAFPASLLINFY